jgi:hypothetical protein
MLEWNSADAILAIDDLSHLIVVDVVGNDDVAKLNAIAARDSASDSHQEDKARAEILDQIFGAVDSCNVSAVRKLK